MTVTLVAAITALVLVHAHGGKWQLAKSDINNTSLPNVPYLALPATVARKEEDRPQCQAAATHIQVNQSMSDDGKGTRRARRR